MDDVWFSTTNWNTVDLRPQVDPGSAIEALPEVVGPGTLGSLRQAMARDSTGQLKALVTQYTQQADPSARDTLLQDILYHWAGVQDIDPASRAATKYYGNVIGTRRCTTGCNWLGTTTPRPLTSTTPA